MEGLLGRAKPGTVSYRQCWGWGGVEERAEAENFGGLGACLACGWSYGIKRNRGKLKSLKGGWALNSGWEVRGKRQEINTV